MPDTATATQEPAAPKRKRAPKEPATPSLPPTPSAEHPPIAKPLIQHLFQPSQARATDCALCGWEQAAHISPEAAASADIAASRGQTEQLEDGRDVPYVVPLPPIQAPPPAAPRQHEMPLGIIPELHQGKPVTEHQVRFGGKSSLLLSRRLERALWESMIVGHAGYLRVGYEVMGDGHARIVDRDGDMVGLAEFRRVRVTGVEVDREHAEQAELGPLFVVDRLTVRRELMAFAERMEAVIRLEDEAEPRTMREQLACVEGGCADLRNLIDDGATPAEVLDIAAGVALEVFRLADLYASGGEAAWRPAWDALCQCEHLAEVHDDLAGPCRANVELVMGDSRGDEAIVPCSCEGWHEPVASPGPGEICGQMHSGHMGPCPYPAASCEFAAVAPAADSPPKSALDELLELAGASCNAYHGPDHLSPCANIAGECTLPVLEEPGE